MNKKISTILLCGMLVLSLTGCSARITFGGKEIFSFSNDKPKEKEQETEQKVDNRKFTDEDIIQSTKAGDFTLTIINDGDYIFKVEEVVNAVYLDPIYTVTYSGNGLYKVVIADNGTSNYITVNITESSLDIVQLCASGIVYNNDDATNKLAQMLYEQIMQGKINKEGRNINEQQETNQQVNEGFYIGDDGMYHCSNCNSVPSKEEYNSGTCNRCSNNEDPMAENNGKHMVELDYNCAWCGTRMYNVYVDGTHGDEFCSTDCEDKWNDEYMRTNQKAYCEYCKKETTVATVEQWYGCCSEYCALQRDGAIYEEMEKNGEISGNTLCGWCSKPISDDKCFCSPECEQAHANN